MALDWNKEISFAGLRQRASSSQGDTSYPEKTYMNLAVVSRKQVNVGQTVAFAIVLALIVGLIVKFGIFDFYARVDAKRAELNASQQTLAALNAELEHYDDVLAEYEGYESMSIGEEGLQYDAVNALALVDRLITPAATVSSLTMSGDTMALNVTDINLDGVGKLVSALYEQDIVKNVSVSTAATQQTASEDVTAALTITIAPSE